MRDDYLTSEWAAEHARATRSIHKLAKGIMHAFKRLNARQFDAPWRCPPARSVRRSAF